MLYYFSFSKGEMKCKINDTVLEKCQLKSNSVLSDNVIALLIPQLLLLLSNCKLSSLIQFILKDEILPPQNFYHQKLVSFNVSS
jgi:hypothetical protein